MSALPLISKVTCKRDSTPHRRDSHGLSFIAFGNSCHDPQPAFERLPDGFVDGFVDDICGASAAKVRQTPEPVIVRQEITSKPGAAITMIELTVSDATEAGLSTGVSKLGPVK